MQKHHHTICKELGAEALMHTETWKKAAVKMLTRGDIK